MAATRKNHRRNKCRKFQAIATRFLLFACTLVLAIAMLLQFFYVGGKILGTQFQLYRVYRNIQYYEEQRDLALKTGRGESANHADQEIEKLNDRRTEIMQSEDKLVAFAAQWQVSIIMCLLGILIIIFPLLFLWIIIIRMELLPKIIDLEEKVFVLALAFLFWLLMWAFYYLMTAFNELYNQTSNLCGTFSPEKIFARIKNHFS